MLAFVRRCAMWSASRVAPYMTALYLMQRHSVDKDFTNALALMDKAESELPPTPVSFHRTAFDNLRSIIFLFMMFWPTVIWSGGMLARWVATSASCCDTSSWEAVPPLN